MEGYLSGVASNLGDSLSWSYNRGNTDWESNTSDGVCNFALQNSAGEDASLIDSISISCGPPNISSTFSQADVREATPYLVGTVQQFAGTAAEQWLEQEVSAGQSSGSVSADKQFGPVAVLPSFGAGQLSENLLWQG